MRIMRRVPDDVPDVRKVADDLDLGLRMVQGLVRLGETGAAARLVEELRSMASTELTSIEIPPPVRYRGMRRRMLLVAAVVGVLGLGVLSAAAMGPGPDRDPSSTITQARPDQTVAGISAVRPAPETQGAARIPSSASLRPSAVGGAASSAAGGTAPAPSPTPTPTDPGVVPSPDIPVPTPPVGAHPPPLTNPVN